MQREKQISRRSYFARYWQLYAMMVLPLLYFLVFKYVPMLGSVLAFRRYRPGMGLFGTEWVGLTYFARFWSDPAFWRAFISHWNWHFRRSIWGWNIPLWGACGRCTHRLSFSPLAAMR